MSSIDDKLLDQAVASLKKAGINFVAFDFDYTLVDQHTGGRWAGSDSDLASTFRPVFAHLIPKLHDAGISLGIVTFSGQSKLIREVLKIVFPSFYTHFVIRGRDRTVWNFPSNINEGKAKFIASAATELNSSPQCEITRGSSLLIDDDKNNIRLALEEKIPAIFLDPTNADRVLLDIISNFGK